MKPIESNNNIITLDNSGTNKRQKKDAGQLPQTPSDSTQGFSAENKQDNNFRVSIPSLLNQDGGSQYFNVYREETSPSGLFGAGQNSSLEKLTSTAIASSQQSLPTSYTITSKRDAMQKAKLKDAVTRHDNFFKAYPSKNYNLDMALVKEAVSAFIKHDNVRDILLYACCYFFTRSDNQAIIPSSQVIENAGAIAKAFSTPITYNEDVIHAASLKIGNRNLYSEAEQGWGYQPLKHIFTFLKNGKINSLESLEGDILSHNNKEHNADEFNKLLIKVILHYGDFASPTNSVKLVSKLEELGCGKEFMDVTTLQPNQVQDMSWEQIVIKFKESDELYDAQGQVVYTSNIPKELRESIIDCNGQFEQIYCDDVTGVARLIPSCGEGVFIAYLVAIIKNKLDIVNLKSYFGLALNKLKKQTKVKDKREFLQAVVTMIEKLDLDKTVLKRITETYKGKNITLDDYDFCKEITKIVEAKEPMKAEARKAKEARKDQPDPDTTTLQPNQAPKNMSWEKIVAKFKESGELYNDRNKKTYHSNVPKELRESIINCNGKFFAISYKNQTRDIPDLIKDYGEGVFITYLMAIKNELDSVNLEQCFGTALDQLKEKSIASYKIKFLQAIVTIIEKSNLTTNQISLIVRTYNGKEITVNEYDFCQKITNIVNKKSEEAKKANDLKVHIVYNGKTLYSKAIPQELCDEIMRCGGVFVNINYSETTSIKKLILSYGEGVFIACLVSIKQGQKDAIWRIKTYFRIALKKLEKNNVGVNRKIEFLQAVVMMIEELSLDKDTLNFIADTYNKSAIALDIAKDVYDFCGEIDKLEQLKQLKHKFFNLQNVIDLTETSVVETPQNEYVAKGVLDINEFQ